jgi:hypothetical protein
MNTATQALGIIFASLVLIVSFPIIISLIINLGPLLVLLGVIAVLLYFAR